MHADAGSLVGAALRLRRGAFDLRVDRVEAEPGRMLAVTGPSGAGKTTLLAVLAGMLVPEEGTVTWAGERVTRRDGSPIPEVSLALQSRALVVSLTAAENLALAVRARGVGAKQAQERALAALERLGIADLADRRLGELSGGQLQRVSVARPLAVAPAVVLVDEPTSEVDEANRDLVLAELRAEAERGAVVVVTTHDVEVEASCDDRLHLDEGQVTSHDVFADRLDEATGPAEPVESVQPVEPVEPVRVDGVDPEAPFRRPAP